jgi:hypothetical protein
MQGPSTGDSSASLDRIGSGAPTSSGAGTSSELQRFRLQHWSITEFEGLLEGVGFIGITVSGDYQDDRVPDPRSSLWSFRAIRP